MKISPKQWINSVVSYKLFNQPQIQKEIKNFYSHTVSIITYSFHTLIH